MDTLPSPTPGAKEWLPDDFRASAAPLGVEAWQLPPPRISDIVRTFETTEAASSLITAKKISKASREEVSAITMADKWIPAAYKVGVK